MEDELNGLGPEITEVSDEGLPIVRAIHIVSMASLQTTSGTLLPVVTRSESHRK